MEANPTPGCSAIEEEEGSHRNVGNVYETIRCPTTKSRQFCAVTDFQHSYELFNVCTVSINLNHVKHVTFGLQFNASTSVLFTVCLTTS
jgi:hypothetical protein